jgi:hypothetical protein
VKNLRSLLTTQHPPISSVTTKKRIRTHQLQDKNRQLRTATWPCPRTNMNAASISTITSTGHMSGSTTKLPFSKLEEDKIGSGHQQQDPAKGVWKWPTNFQNLFSYPLFFLLCDEEKAGTNHDDDGVHASVLNKASCGHQAQQNGDVTDANCAH